MKKLINFSALLTFLLLAASSKASDYETLKAVLSDKSIPLVNIVVDQSAINKDNYIGGTIEISDYEKRTEGMTTVSYNCMVRYRGSSSLAFDKRSLNIKLVDADGADLNVAIFGIRPENSWILDAMPKDPSRMRNRVCADLWNEISKTPYETKYEQRNGTAGLHVELFFNGNYHGLYCMSDKIDRKLLGLKKAKADGDNMVVRGVLYKGSTWGSGSKLTEYADSPTDVADWNAWELQYPNDFANKDTWQPLMSIIDFCSDQTSDAAFLSQVKDYFYLDNLADYYAFACAMNLRESGYKNTFLSTPNLTEAHCYLVSPWDMDASFGSDGNADAMGAMVSIGRFDDVAPFNRLMAKNIYSFADLCKQRWQQLTEGVLSANNVEAAISTMKDKLTESGAWQREVEKWNNNPVELNSSLDACTQYMTEWYKQNAENISNQFDPTGISSIDSGKQAGEQTMYDLQGRKHDKANVHEHGIYIVGNRKYIKD